MSVGIRRERFDDPRLVRFADSVQQAFMALGEAFRTGLQVTLSEQSGAGLVRVTHNLGRVAQGFLVLDLRRAAGTTTDVSIYRREGDVSTATALDIYTTGAWESCRVWVY